MSLNSTPSGERIHISFFGKRNAGKSSLVNAVTDQELSVVSEVKGTTTDPVKKSMELLPLGPVIITDTPGFDDEGNLGQMRVNKTNEVLVKTDVAVLVVDASTGISDQDKAFINIFCERKIPFVIAYNKSDLVDSVPATHGNEIYVSAQNKDNIDELKKILGKILHDLPKAKPIIDDLIKAGDLVVLVTPIDSSAPKGRLILPQQITLRNILDNNCTAVVCKETELPMTLHMLSKKPDLVITDSQVFGTVSKIIPEDIKLTSFSIIFARYKGDLEELVKGASVLSKLNDGDKVLISEGCTHHRQCNDIGTVKMPEWIKNYTGKNVSFDFTSGGEFQSDMSKYSLVVHCGGCMLNDKEMQSRIDKCKSVGVPIANYGVAIAMMHGILRRSIEVFPKVLRILE